MLITLAIVIAAGEIAETTRRTDVMLGGMENTFR